MVLARKIAYNVVFNSIAKVLATVLALVAIGLITRYLGLDGFGDYATMLAFFAFFNALGDFGLAPVAAREIGREGAEEERIMGGVFALRLLISSVIFIVTPILIFFLPYPEPIRWAILLSALAFVFSSSAGVLNGIFQKHLVMDRVSTAELCGKIVQLSVIALAVYNDWGFLPVASSLLAYMVFNLVVVFWLARRYTLFRLRWDTAFFRHFLRESMPVGVMAIVTFAYFKMDTILLSLFTTSAEVGVYNLAYKIIENLTFFPAMVVGLILPLLARFIFTDRSKFESIANKTFKVFMIFIVPLVVGGFMLAPQLVSLVGGEAFLESAGALRILIFALGFIFLGNFFNAVLLAGNQQKRLMRALIAVAVLNVVANLILIPKFSYVAAAGISVLTEMLVVIVGFSLSRKYAHYTPVPENILKIIFSGALMALFLWWFGSWPFIALALAAGGVYATSLWLTRAIGQDEIMSLLVREKAVMPVDIVP